MSSLTTCLKKAGKFISEEDRNAILANARHFKAEGASAADAASRAVDAQLEQVRSLLIALGDKVPTAAAPKAEKASRGIEDFGEVLTGARKHYAEEYAARRAEAGKLDVKAEPLSKSWPEPDYAKLLEGGTDPWSVSFVRVAREAIPNKPVSSWKLKGWAQSVTSLRDFADKLLDGQLTKDDLLAKLGTDGPFRNIAASVELYQRFGHEKSLKGIHVRASSYSMRNGVTYNPARTFWTVEREAKATAFSRWPHELAVGDTRDQALDAFGKVYAQLGTEKGEAKSKADPGRFVIYTSRTTKGYTVGAKVGKVYVDLKRFDTIKEAREYKTEHAAELAAQLEKWKDVPFERRTDNAPRVGADHRMGGNVSPQQFSEAFGFRGVQFGNYVEGARRQRDLNDAYDALMDLSSLIGVPPRALSLNGTLGLAFGARGTGGKNAGAAHFEPGTVVINLTKNAGAGSLAHEWFHSVDNYFAVKAAATGTSGKSGGAYMTAGVRDLGSVRPEIAAAFNGVMAAIRSTAMRERARSLDKRRTKEYWGSDLEMAARAFESYVIAKLNDQGASNDYLANIVDEKFWKAAEALSGHEGEDTYPYPKAGEMPAIRQGFDAFLEALQAREDGGKVELFSPEAEYRFAESGVASL
jgi:hypothetical protein